MYAILDENDKILSFTSFNGSGGVDVKELGEFAKVGMTLWGCWKVKLKKELWALLPEKVKGAKKNIIGKPDMSDEELEVQLQLYREKYEDAKNGLDVFEGQALEKGVSQEEYRAFVIAKGDEFVLSDKLIADRIELVRGMMEDRINKIDSLERLGSVIGKFEAVGGFDMETPVGEIVNSLE